MLEFPKNSVIVFQQADGYHIGRIVRPVTESIVQISYPFGLHHYYPQVKPGMVVPPNLKPVVEFVIPPFLASDFSILVNFILCYKILIPEQDMVYAYEKFIRATMDKVRENNKVTSQNIC